MLGEINLNLKPLNPQLSICLPSGTVIGNLKEVHNITNDILLGKVNELSFTIPYTIESNHELAPNPNIDKLKDRFLIKFQLGNETEFYMINNIKDTGDDSKLEKQVHAYSLAWELADKLIREYQDTKNAQDVLTDTLTQTIWSVGYVDSDFILKSRTFDVSEKTVLDFLFEIADTFNGILEFDTEHRQISLKKEDNIGINKGLCIQYGKYLKTIDKESDSDQMVTQLHIYGSEGISIQSVNPTGADYIESFDYFLYPFERDVNRNVLTHSDYMSDSLCHAILDYQLLAESKKDEFNTLLTQLNSQQSNYSNKQVELGTLQNELKIIQDKIDLANATNDDTSTLITQKNSKQSEIDAKNAEIDLVLNDISNTTNSITMLRNDISLENNFTHDQLIERNQYIIEKTWSDDNFIDENDLYEEAKKRFEEMRKPKTTFTIDVVNFLSILEEQHNWDKLSIGDTVNVKYPQMNVEITAKIIEIHFDYESDNITLTISNTADVIDEATKLAKKIYDSYSTSTTLDMSKYKWNKGLEMASEVNDIINNTWDSNKRMISAGINNSVSLSGRGLIITDPDNPNNMLIGQSGILAISNDSGNTWKHAITSEGIVGERIFGKLIAGVNLTIDASDTNGIKTFTVDGNGVTISGASLTITDGGIKEENLDPNYVDGVNNAIESMQDSIDSVFSDLKLTSIEANILETTLKQLKSESTDLINVASSLNITTEKTDYNNALADLDVYLTTNFINQSIYPIDITLTQRDLINTKMQNVQSKKSVLINKISQVRQSNSVLLGNPYNEVVITSTDGLVATKQTTINNVTTKYAQVKLNATDGIRIQKTTNNGTSWTDSLYIDTNGILNAKDINITGIFTGNKMYGGNVVSRVTLDGSEGIKIQKTSNNGSTWTDNLYIDTDGTIVAKNIKIDGGSITWSNVGKPTYSASDVGARPADWVPTAAEVKARADTWFPTPAEIGARSNTWTPTADDVGAMATKTYIDANNVFTGYVYTDRLRAGAAKITTALIENLVVGTNVSMGANARITWSQITDPPPSVDTSNFMIKSTYIDANNVFTGNIYANKIISGSLSSKDATTVFNLDDGSFRMGGNKFFRIGNSDTDYKIKFSGNLLDINARLTSDSVMIYNPNASSASVSLSWLNNQARIRVGGTGSGANGGLEIQGVSDVRLLYVNNNGDMQVNSVSTGSLSTISGITANNVGITCNASLYVGSASTMNGKLTTYAGIEMNTSGLVCHANGVFDGNLTVKGTINGTTIPSSDINVKKDINKYNEFALDKILNIPVYTYRYKDEENDAPLSIGIIAQESPQELVVDIVDDDGNFVSYGINHYSLTSMLLKAIQELSAQVKYLDEKLDKR